MKYSKSVQDYLDATAQLFGLRREEESPEEESHLDRMDLLWEALTPEEVDIIEYMDDTEWAKYCPLNEIPE